MKGGSTWHNNGNQSPQGTSYQEWDVNVKVPGLNRDGERIVTGTEDGSAYWAGDHHDNFVRFR